MLKQIFENPKQFLNFHIDIFHLVCFNDDSWEEVEL